MTQLYQGDCLHIMVKILDANSIDAIVCDPPYGLEFMGKDWDKGVPGIPYWAEALRVLKPGGHLLAFGGTRTYHRMASAIEDAGFELRDCVMWLYGQGFPKSHDVSKAIDKAAGAKREVIGRKPGERYKYSFDSDFNPENPNSRLGSGDAGVLTAPATEAAKQWQGWGTALKPSYEPIAVARKPLIGTVADNVQTYGTGALNIDACRVEGEPWTAHDATGLGSVKFFIEGETPVIHKEPHALGRWPANVILNEESAKALDERSSITRSSLSGRNTEESSTNIYGWAKGGIYKSGVHFGDTGGASRFFYCAKTSKKERGENNNHPTVKPLALMQYLCKLVTQPGGIILDPFMGSGSTAVAAIQAGFSFIGIEKDAKYFQIAEQRIRAAEGQADAGSELDSFLPLPAAPEFPELQAVN